MKLRQVIQLCKITFAMKTINSFNFSRTGFHERLWMHYVLQSCQHLRNILTSNLNWKSLYSWIAQFLNFQFKILVNIFRRGWHLFFLCLEMTRREFLLGLCGFFFLFNFIHIFQQSWKMLMHSICLCLCTL